MKNDEKLAVSPATAALLKELYTDAPPLGQRMIASHTLKFDFSVVERAIRAFGESIRGLQVYAYRQNLPQLSPETSRLLDELYGPKVQA